jgi:hypothetical protein
MNPVLVWRLLMWSDARWERERQKVHEQLEATTRAMWPRMGVSAEVMEAELTRWREARS